jgi:hypothetical protein
MKKLLLSAALLSLPLTAYATPIGITGGTVTLTQVGTTVTFDVVLNPGVRFAESNQSGGQLFSFNDTIAGSTITNIASSPNTPAGGLSGFTNLPPVQTDAGLFTASVECTVASECPASVVPDMTELKFTVTNATVAELSVPNAAGFAFLAGTVAPAAAVLEPTTLALLGVGLAGLAFAKRRHTP